MFQDYYKALEDADEKVQLANQIYDLVRHTHTLASADQLRKTSCFNFHSFVLTLTSQKHRRRISVIQPVTSRWQARADSLTAAGCVPQVDRHLRKLDQELAKFKMELEADNAGITEVLERRESDCHFLSWSQDMLAHFLSWSQDALAHFLSSSAGSLEMDSPSQPVNNHHVHSHTPAESESMLLIVCVCLCQVVVDRVCLTLCCGYREEVQRPRPPHHRTRPGEEVQVRGAAVHAHV